MLSSIIIGKFLKPSLLLSGPNTGWVHRTLISLFFIIFLKTCMGYDLTERTSIRVCLPFIKREYADKTFSNSDIGTAKITASHITKSFRFIVILMGYFFSKII